MLLATCVVLCLTVFFPIENLSANGSSIYKSEQIVKASGIEKGDNLFAIAKGDVLKKLKSKLPYVEEIELEREIPDSLTIKVTDAGEFACYYDGKNYYTVSHTDWVLKKDYEQPVELFTVYGAKVKCKVGSGIIYNNEEQKNLLDKMIQALNEEKLKINSIDITDNVAISLKIEDRFEVYIGTSNFIPEKIRHLSSMVENISPEKSGKINLSMWSNANSQGTFVEQTNE